MIFKHRNTDMELMDDPNLKIEAIRKILKDVDKANALLGGHGITLRAIRQLAKEYPQEAYTIVDMGCGDGSMLRKVALYCNQQSIKVKCIGVDLNENSIHLAKEQSINFPNIEYLKQDILALDSSSFQCDILLCTLTMHHFSDEQITIFLRKFASLATIGVVINDLERSKLAYLLFKMFSFFMMKTKIAKHDGLISIKSGFTKKDLAIFSNSLTNMVHTIRWRWAFRYEWVMKHPQNKN